jgi:hypothetical protein
VDGTAPHEPARAATPKRQASARGEEGFGQEDLGAVGAVGVPSAVGWSLDPEAVVDLGVVPFAEQRGVLQAGLAAVDPVDQVVDAPSCPGACIFSPLRTVRVSSASTQLRTCTSNVVRSRTWRCRDHVVQAFGVQEGLQQLAHDTSHFFERWYEK